MDIHGDPTCSAGTAESGRFDYGWQLYLGSQYYNSLMKWPRYGAAAPPGHPVRP